jgi:hypothetical protein
VAVVVAAGAAAAAEAAAAGSSFCTVNSTRRVRRELPRLLFFRAYRAQGDLAMMAQTMAIALPFQVRA